MTVYIILLFLSIIILSLKDSFIYNNFWLRKIVILLSSFFMLLLSVYRSYSVGKDYSMYHGMFSNYDSFFLKSHLIEPGYVDLNSLAQNLNNFKIIPAACFIVFFIGLYLLSRSCNINEFVFLSSFVMTYTFFMSFNLMRQTMALGFVCMGIYLFIKFSSHRIFKYVITAFLLVVAQQFHNSATFCFLFLFLITFKINKRLMFPYYFIVSYLFITNALGSLATLLISYSSYYSEKYAYTYNFFTGEVTRTLPQFILLIIQVLFIHLYMIHDENYFNNIKSKFIINGYIFYTILVTCSNPLLSRLKFYFIIFFLLFSCLMFASRENENRTDAVEKNWELIKLSYLVFLIIYYILELIIVNNGAIVPYKFIWQL